MNRKLSLKFDRNYKKMSSYSIEQFSSQKALENSLNTPTNTTTFLDKTSLPSSISLEEEQIPIEMIGKMSL